MSDHDPLEVVYNDTCPICSREVSMYKSATDDDVVYHGLSSCDLQRFGLSPEQAAREFHVLHKGELISGLAAFALLWERMPRMKWLARLVRIPVLSIVLEWIYTHILARALFAMHQRRQARLQ
ncbi:thiol-disulfide oxidoreductase DCC family protein [Primorskyibacter sp. S187A]|uniref:thiol-disulfide oxidoreductase DCC family protein n=1 Tax=Primorskyibacter sp. S187A TaxID=3415130 RepID=UPI003C7DD455